MCVCRSPSGSCIVTPSARPRGMMVTLWSGSACGSSAATTAWPDSWYAQVTRSCSLIVQRLALGAHQHLVARLIEIVVGDDLTAAADREQRRLVDQVRELGAREAGRATGNLPEIDVRVERNFLRVDAENLLATLDVGRADGHLTIEAAGTQQRRIENVGAVGRRDDDDALIGREAVHLDEQLVERLLALFMAERVAAAGCGRPRRARR